MNYIAVEGCDGTGKTTLAKETVKQLGDDAKFFYEPYGDTEVCKSLRTFCLDKKYRNEVNWRAREYMMLANRAISTELVKNFFITNPNGTVISDRSLVSGMVYAYVASNMSFVDWWSLASKAFWVLPTVIVHVTVKEQKINVVKGDIYDEASDDFHTMIKITFPQAIHFLTNELNIKVIEFENDFNVKPIENANNLITKLPRS